MPFAQNLPFFSILLPILCGVVCLSLGSAAARRLTLAALTVECVVSAVLLVYAVGTGESFTYMMGHFPAPFGNEIRAGALEAFMALAFSAVMLLSSAGGLDDAGRDIPEKKHNYLFLMLCFLLAAMLTIIYTNDIFTAYVFIEIITLSACSVIAVKEGGKPLIAAMSYLIMSLIGSALLLLSIALLYTITGHLLMPQLRSGIGELAVSGSYDVPMFILTGLMITGLGIKSALFPFHSWLPNAHAHATTAASSVLSGLIVKCYLLLMIKLLVRVFGLDTAAHLRSGAILMVLGTLGLIAGSVIAIKQRDIKQMLSYSTVAQVGYICIAIGLGSEAGMAAACFHIAVHAAAKSMLFTSAGGLIRASGHKKDFGSLCGAARRDPASGAAFICGALSMVGIPLFSGFVSKLYTSAASVGTQFEASAILAVVVVSTVMNAMYYFPMVVCILAKQPAAEEQAGAAGGATGAGGTRAEAVSGKAGGAAGVRSAAPGSAVTADGAALVSSSGAGAAPVKARAMRTPAYNAALAAFLLINLSLGVFSQPVFKIIEQGIKVFG